MLDAIEATYAEMIAQQLTHLFVTTLERTPNLYMIWNRKFRTTSTGATKLHDLLASNEYEENFDMLHPAADLPVWWRAVGSWPKSLSIVSSAVQRYTVLSTIETQLLRCIIQQSIQKTFNLH